jgi:hypothetical protein
MLIQQFPLKVYRLKANLLETTITACTANELGGSGNQVYFLRAVDLARLINTCLREIKEELKIICGENYMITYGTIEDKQNHVKIALVDILTYIKYIAYHARIGDNNAIRLMSFLFSGQVGLLILFSSED